MASTASTKLPGISQADINDFHETISSSKRILALVGAGLSASSGLPTFRGVGGLWREHDATELATPEAFDAQPALVWQFYNYRRHMALKAKPNPAHYALAELAKRKEGFQTLSQNVDGKFLSLGTSYVCIYLLTHESLGLSQRAGHPRSSLHLLHGSLYDIKCTDFYCKHFENDNFTDPIVPSLGLNLDDFDSSATKQALDQNKDGDTPLVVAEPDLANADVPMPEVAERDLPHCPTCKKGLLRPGVVWFGEMLPEKVIRNVDEWIAKSTKIDLIMVIGTSARVYPAAGYVQRARAKGAKVAVINMDPNDIPATGMKYGDWLFVGDAAQIMPELLRPVIGDLVDIAGEDLNDEDSKEEKL
jgi:NAD-dependent deacetylase sirtuin 5